MNKRRKEKQLVYSLRKLKFGAASVAVSSLIWLGSSAPVYAEEVDPVSETEEAESDVVQETDTNAAIEEETDSIQPTETDSTQETLEGTEEVVQENVVEETTEENDQIVQESEEVVTQETVEEETTEVTEQTVQESVENTEEVVQETTEETVEQEATLSVAQQDSVEIDVSSLTDTQSVSVSIVDQVITILSGGEYTITGENESAQVVIDDTVTEDVLLTLKNAIINTIVSASKSNTVTIEVPEGTQSVVSDDASNTNKGAIQVKGNLELTGSGTLYVYANSENAHAIKVGDALSIQDLLLICYSEMKDGIHTDETVTIDNATITIEALQGDGIQVEDDSGVGEDNNGNIVINSGSVTVTSDGQSLQATNDITINGGTVVLTSNASEGIEGRHVIINGGTVTVTAYDDGINATDFTNKSSYIEDGGTLVAGYTVNDMGIEIHGGTVNVTAGGDGLDSNGYILVDGGTSVIASTGASDQTSSALDHDGTATINGGTVWLLSTYNGMPESFNTGSQATIASNTNATAGQTVTVKDQKGNIVDSLTVNNTTSYVIYSSDALTNGQTYTINNASTTATTTGQNTMMPGMMNAPMNGQMPDFQNMTGMPMPPTGMMPMNQDGTMPAFPSDMAPMSQDGTMPAFMNQNETGFPQAPMDFNGSQPALSTNGLPSFENAGAFGSWQPNPYEEAVTDLSQALGENGSQTPPEQPPFGFEGGPAPDGQGPDGNRGPGKQGKDCSDQKEKVQTSVASNFGPMAMMAVSILGMAGLKQKKEMNHERIYQ